MVAAIESTIQITVTLGAVISPAVAVISQAVAVISPVLEEEVGNRRCLKLNAFRYFYFIQKVFYLIFVFRFKYRITQNNESSRHKESF